MIGELNTLVRFERKTRERDDLLKLPEKWEEIGTAWCGIEVESAGEATTGQQLAATHRWRLETHWSEPVDVLTPLMRVRIGTRTLEIESVMNAAMRNRTITVVCREII